MLNDELKAKLREAKSLEEVEDVLKDYPGLKVEEIWKEIENHQGSKNEKLDLDELDAVSGGSRDWQKDGCAATCESGSWCWSNDHCAIFDVQYDNFWKTCPDGHEHTPKQGVCTRCGCNVPDEFFPGVR